MAHISNRLLLLLCVIASGLCAEEQPIPPYALTLNGHFTQGALIQGSIIGGDQSLASLTRLFVNQSPIEVSKHGKFIFGFSKDAPLTQTLNIIYPDGRKIQQSITLTKHTYDVQKIYGIDNAYTPSAPVSAQAKKNQQRAKLDRQQVRAARAINTPINAAFSEFIWPLEGKITGVYGSQRFYNDQAGSPHYGIDIAGKSGTTVVAPNDGIIRLAVPDMFYSGGTLIIDHGFGLSSSFLHLSKLSVKVGDKIKQGEKIGEVGSTGRSTGAHLDWRINWYKMRLDPELIMFDSLTAHKHTSDP